MSELDFDRSDPPIMPGRGDARSLVYLGERQRVRYEERRRAHLLYESIIPKLGNLTADQLTGVDATVDSMANADDTSAFAVEHPGFTLREPIVIGDLAESASLKGDITDAIGRIGIDALREVHVFTERLVSERPHGYNGVANG